jgi:dienelactone hydrolase
MPKRILALSVAILALALFPATQTAAKGLAADATVDHFFSAIRNNNFDAATTHFSARMKAFSPAGLKASWNDFYKDEGPLLSWNIFARQTFSNGRVEARVQLRFHSSKANSMVVVNPPTSEITSVLFKMPVTVPPYAEQSKFQAEDVAVGDYKLPGTLTIPNGKGPFPAAVLIQGSGPADRDETLGPNHPFADIAQGLSSRGIIVLRFDKRSYAFWNTDPKKTTVDNEVIQDAVAAVRILRARRDVARERIFVVGHGLGAMLAPEIATKARPVAGIVMLAPVGRKLPQLMVEQARFLGQASPRELSQIEQQANQLSAHKMDAKQMFMGAPASYYYDLETRDEVAIARSLDVPILILDGSRDYPGVDADIRYWQAGLKGDGKVRVETLPALNHLFMAGTGKPNPAELYAPGHVDVSVISKITGFIASAGHSN